MDWHLFDVVCGYEIRRLDDDSYEVRPVDDPDDVVTLSAVEFEQWRSTGDNPKGLP